jgi:hypothetical protein
VYIRFVTSVSVKHIKVTYSLTSRWGVVSRESWDRSDSEGDSQQSHPSCTHTPPLTEEEASVSKNVKVERTKIWSRIPDRARNQECQYCRRPAAIYRTGLSSRFQRFSFRGSSSESCRSQCPLGLKLELSSLDRTLGSWVRISFKAWMSIVCIYSVYVLFCM